MIVTKRSIVAAMAALVGGAFLPMVEPASAFPISTPRFADLKLSASDHGEPQSTFAPDTARIVLRAKLVDMAAKTKVVAVWIAEKTKIAPPNFKIDSSEFIVGPNNVASFGLSKPTAGWPIGDYRIDLTIDGAPAESVRFKIAP